jgi:hypothetical protein
VLRRVPPVAYHVKDGEKGPMVWEAKGDSLVRTPVCASV